MTTITSTEPATITPCPVDWCDDAGHHAFFGEEDVNDLGERLFSERRICRHETGSIALSSQDEPVVFGVEVLDGYDGKVSAPRVNIGNAGDVDLESANEVAAAIRALLAAGRIAFPKSELDDVWTPEDAALLERFQDLMQELGSTRAIMRELVSRRDRQLEFDAAVAEVCERAGQPGNKADAAAIRLRNARAALRFSVEGLNP